MRTWKWAVLAALGVAQVIQPDRARPEIDPAQDLIALTKPSNEVVDLLHQACYDCHSSNTTYPWYAYITPVNWWLQDHINEGREEGNLSDWGALPERKRAHFVDEAAELLQEREMPLPSYTWVHADARLNDAQRKVLADFFQSLPEAAVEWRPKGPRHEED